MISTNRKPVVGRLAMAGLALLLLVLGISVLMPSLQRAKELSREAIQASSQWSQEYDAPMAPEAAQADRGPANADKPPVIHEAVVKSFDASIDLTPKLSVGTAQPESIYDATFQATIQAVSPSESAKTCRIALPLPPQIISLAELTITVNDDPSDKDFGIDGNRLIWTGSLDATTPKEIKVKYSATGKGVYTLEKPSGRIIDTFKTKLTANRSNIRMLELSLQPTTLSGEGGKTEYVWEYERLVVSRPIALDVLGVASVDRLGKLVWLGPITVLIYGVLLAIGALAIDPDRLDGWMLLLVAGAFAVAYPLMYFLQESVSLPAAIAVSGAVVLAIMLWRSVSLFGLARGIGLGLILPAGILALAVATAMVTSSAMQGVLLTVTGLVVLVVSMALLPRAQKNLRAMAPARPTPAVPPTPPRPAGVDRLVEKERKS